jgi:N-acetylmuramoyl-L-alanine amidase
MISGKRVSLVLLVLLTGNGCAGQRGSLSPLSPPPTALGPLEIRFAYPKVADTVVMRGDTTVYRAAENQMFPRVDSVFVFGTVGRGDAQLTVNGVAVEVFPTGGWIAWLPLPDDSVALFVLSAVSGDEVRLAMLAVPVRQSYTRPLDGVWIDTTSFNLAGNVWLQEGEGYPLSVSAHPEAIVDLLFPDGSSTRMLAEDSGIEESWGELAFGTGAGASEVARRRFVLWRRGDFGPNPGEVLAPNDTTWVPDPTWVAVRAVVDADTIYARWPLRLGTVRDFPPVVAYVDDDPTRTGRTDGVTPGRPSVSGTYHWFFPNGTVARVSGRIGGRARLQLSSQTASWMNARDLVGLPEGTPPPVGTTNPIRLRPGEESLVLRMPLDRRYPFRVDEAERSLTVTLYGVAADMDWLQYGGSDPLVEMMSFAQRGADEVTITLELSELVWGYRTRWDGNALLLEIRRPPELKNGNPLAGLRVALDAGHPPAGSTGPTLVGEWEVTLAVARKARDLLEQQGAQVVLVRNSEDALGLADRVERAENSGADILVSVHANALPDGVNPFANNGTSVYYYQPRSARLALELNRALVSQFGSRDLGFGRADLAMARPTWMPAALTEGLFMMLPDQEAVLTSEDGQLRYARGIVDGLKNFLEYRRDSKD